MAIRVALIMLAALAIPSMTMAEPTAEPAAASGAAELDTWVWETVTPAGWEISLDVPAWGDLLVRGIDAATDEDLEDNDLMWLDDRDELEGPFPFEILGSFIAEEAITEVVSSTWTGYNVGFKAEMEESGLVVIETDLRRRYGGRRWIRYLMRTAEDDGQRHVVLTTLVPGGAYLVMAMFDNPAPELIEPVIERMLGAAETAPEQAE